MKRFNDLKISARLTIGFSIMILFMAIIGLTGFNSARKIQKSLDEIFHVRLPSIDHLMETGSEIQEMVASERTMIFTNAESDEFKELINVYEENLKLSDERWQKYKELPATPEEAEIIPKYEKAREEWKEISKKVVDGRIEDTRAGRRMAMDLTTGNAKKKFEEMREYLDKLEEINLNIAKQANEEASETYKETIITLAGITGFGLFVGVILVITISRNIIGRVRDTVEMLKDVAQGEGDLTKRLRADSHDEIGELSRWFNTFVEKIQDIVRNISNNSDNLASSSEQLSTTTDDLRQGADEQAQQIEQSATTITEMSQTIVDVAKNSSEASGAAKEASEIASEGKKIVEESVSSIMNISKTVEVSAKTVDELGASSKQIGEIITVIEDIAAQTNLLALNAAIEAARAGEQGRGFSVVADEVRKLAERTGGATGEISEMIKKIQNDIEISVKSIDEGQTQVNEGVELSEKAKESLGKIVATSQRCLNMMEMIATATEQQSSAIEEVSMTMVNIADGSRSSKEGVSQINDSSNNLARLAGDLRDIVSRFRIDPESGNAASRSSYSSVSDAENSAS
jgi:methyl-accepting chemotaxis protein